MDDIKKQQASNIVRGIDNAGKTIDSDHPSYLSIAAIIELIRTLGDDNNESLTQLNIGDYKNFYVDETYDFASAIHFAKHPMDSICIKLERRGIRKRVPLGEFTVPKKDELQALKSLQVNDTELTKTEVKDTGNDTITITKYRLDAIHIEDRPLAEFAHEWMKRRVPANRKRVKEIIDFANALSDRLGGVSPPQRIGGRDMNMPPERRV